MKWILIIFLTLPFRGVMAQMPNWVEVSLDQTLNITNIEKDTFGFLWLSAGAELFRFNGMELHQKLKLNEEEISALSSNKGLLYIGTSKGRLLSFDPSNAKSEFIVSEHRDYRITDICIVDESNYILLSYGNGIFITFDNQEHRITTENGLVSDEVYNSQLFDSKYYVSSDQGIAVINVESNEYHLQSINTTDGLSDLVISHLEVKDETIWYADYDNTVGVIDMAGEITNFPLPIRSKINDVVCQEGSVIVATDDGIYSLENEKWISKHTKPDGATFIEIQADEEDNLWALDSRKNLHRGNIRFQKLAIDLENIRAISKHNGIFYLGNEDGLFAFSENGMKQIGDQNITYLKHHDGHLLVGTFSNGVVVYNAKDEITDRQDNWAKIANESVLSIYPVGNIIYVSSLSGVMQFELTQSTLTPIKSLNPIIGQTYIYTMLKHDDNMCFGTDRNGLIVWDTKEDRVSEINNFESGEKIGSIYSMTLDDAGALWITSSEKGVAKVIDQKANYINHVENLADEYTSIAAVKDHSILLIRNMSIDLLEPKSDHLKYYSRELGVSEGAAFLNTLTQDEDNTYFVHDNNVYLYNSSKNQKNHPEIVIDNILVNLSPADSNNTFAQSENNIQIEYNGSWLTDPSKLSYQYKLLGFDDEWRNTKDNSVAFPKLAPGDYNFIVRASENEVFSNEPIANYTFKIKRHLMNHWWVKVLIAGLLSFLVFRWWKSKENRQKEKLALEKLNVENQLINLKNQLNPHFLFNAFNTLIGLIEEDSDRSVAFVERMTDFYRSMLELGKENMISLKDEVTMLDQYIGILQERFVGQLQIEKSIDELSGFQLPPLTLQLLLENAVKHNVVSSKDPLLIKIKQEGNQIVIWNRKNQLVSSNPGSKTGLVNIKRRYELAGLPSPVIHDSNDAFEIIINLKQL